MRSSHCHQRVLLLCAIVYYFQSGVAYSKTITAYPPTSRDTIIHHQYIPNISLDNEKPLSISSNVAVTIQRYSDNHNNNNKAWGGQQMQKDPIIGANEAMLVVTTNCASSSFTPTITLDGDGDDESSGRKSGVTSIDINVQGVDTEIMYPFLYLHESMSTSYHVDWTAINISDDPSCNRYRNGSKQPPPYTTANSSIKQRYLHGNGNNSNYLRIKSSAATKKLVEEEEEANGNTLLLSNMCMVNVDIMLDGCAHTADMHVTASMNTWTDTPAVRFFDTTSVITNKAATQEEEEDDCWTDMESDITFTRSEEESLLC